MAGLLVGLDFDNTIICYDKVFIDVARDVGVVSEEWPHSKKEIRDHIRRLPDGEVRWQEVQARVYGLEINRAEPAAGVLDFISQCVREAIPLCIVSHKTAYARRDTAGINLRASALEWLRENGIVGQDRFISVADVHFESTREEKIGRIRALGCTHFVDDLEELFSDASFPDNVKKLLYSPQGVTDASDLKVFSSWDAIGNYLLDEFRFAC